MRIRPARRTILGWPLFLLSILGTAAAANPVAISPALKRVRLIASIAEKSPVFSSGIPVNGVPVNNVPTESRINDSEFAADLSTRLDASGRFRVIDAPGAVDYEFRGLLFSQQMLPGWDAKVVLAARYELIDAKTHKTIWRQTTVTSCPFRNWGGLLAPEPKIGAAVTCAMDKNLNQMAAMLNKVSFSP